MASASCFNSLLLPLFIFLIMIVSAAATSSSSSSSSPKEMFKVGKSGIWRIPDADNTDVYNQWAALNRFLVGDSLYFEYKKDSVLVVEKKGYYQCNSTNPITVFNDGKTVFKLEKPGPIYFISGAPDHCKNGQRMIINVMAIIRTTHPPSVVSEPPSPSPSPTPNSGVSIGISPIPVVALIMAGILLWGAPILHLLRQTHPRNGMELIN